MHLRLLAGMEVKFQGLLHLAYFTTSLLSFADNGFPSDRPSTYAPLPERGEQTTVVQRTLTAAAKAVICKVSCIALQECQEGLGGVGYMDEPDEPEFNISRLYRDTAANMTWEGTTNVLSSEVVRHLLAGKNLDIFSAWLEGGVIEKVSDHDVRVALGRSWAALKQRLSGGASETAVILAEGREIMFSMAWVVSGALLALDAQRDGNEAARELSRRWTLDGKGGVGEYVIPEVVNNNQRRNLDPNERLNWDCRLVWGVDMPADAALGYRGSTKKSSGEPEKMVARL